MIGPVGNPFFHRGPIRDPAYFCGRERMLARALGFLAQGQSVSLVGPRRVGKTSLLLHLARPAVQRAHGLDDQALRCVYLGSESWGQLAPEAIYGRLRGAASGEPVAGAGTATFGELEQAVYAALRDGGQLALMLDEFDALAANPHLDKDFFSSLRALATEHRLAYVTVSSRPLLALPYAHTKTRSSPFFNFFAQIRVGLFSAEESAGLLGRLATLGGHTFTPAQITQLLDLAGPHPLFLQIAGYHTIDQLSADGGAPQRLRAAFEEEAGDHWAHLWQARGTKLGSGSSSMRTPLAGPRPRLSSSKPRSACVCESAITWPVIRRSSSSGRPRSWSIATPIRSCQWRRMRDKG